MPKNILVLGFFILLPKFVFATPPILNKTELFMRCYTQLTQTRISFSHPLLQAVRLGTKDPIKACLEVFDSAKFNSQDRISNVNDLDAKRVLRALHKLHTSFFTYRDIPAVVADGGVITRDIFDSETPAYYFTRSLFKPNTDFRSVTTLNANLRAIRTDPDPTNGPASNLTKVKTIFGEPLKFAPKGELLGIETTGPLSTHYEYFKPIPAPTPTPVPTPVLISGDEELGKHYGGGVLGSLPYLLTLLLHQGPARPNGAHMFRIFSKAMFSDMLCRELPVIRFQDAALFKDRKSEFSFRNTQGCVQCHASMDRAAAVVRGFSYKALGRLAVPDPLIGGNFVTFFNPNKGPGTEWPVKVDTSYFRKEADGVFYFRNSDGDLVDIPVRGLAALGETLAAQKDFYLCTAKRYYSYFTGVNVQIGDPQSIGKLSDTDEIHKKNVDALADKLQQTQRLRELVVDILNLPEYRKSSFGADR